MMTDAVIERVAAGRRRIGRRYRLRSLSPAYVPLDLWSRFWSDRQAVRLKFIILGLCLAATALLEVRW